MSTTNTRLPSQHTTIRIRHEDLAEIDRQAHALRISRSAFLVDSALKRLPDHRNQLEHRIDQLEATVQRLEQAANLGAF